MGNDKRERHKVGHQIRRAEQAAAQRRRQRARNGKIAGAAGVAVAIIVVLALVAGGCGSGSSGSSSSTSSTAANGSSTTASPTTQSSSTTASSSGAFAYGTSACPATDGSSKRTITFTSAPKDCLDAGKTYTATFATTAGAITVDLDTSTTPGTANNFIFLSRYHYYDNTKIFRAASSIDILQGGSPHTQTNADPGPGYTIPDEPAFTTSGGQLHGPYTYKAGDLVMARTSAANSASAQFFFVTGPNGAQLNSQGTYVVFGHVTSGLDLLQQMQASATPSTDPNALQGDETPNPPVTVQKVTITEK